MLYSVPKCPICGETLQGECDLTPGCAEVEEQPDGSFEYSGYTKMFWDGQVNERDREQVAMEATGMLAALKATLVPLMRLGDFVGNEDKGGVSGLGAFDRCAIIGQVRDAIERAEALQTKEIMVQCHVGHMWLTAVDYNEGGE